MKRARASVLRGSGPCSIAWGLLWTCLLSGCVDVGQESIELELSARGVALDAIDGRDGYTITLTRADLAFGPLYLCASHVAGDLCETARAQWLDSAVVDALDPDARTLGQLEGLTGTVQSLMYDAGFAFPLASASPTETEAGAALATSIALEGIAGNGQRELRFSARVATEPRSPGRSLASGQLEAHRLSRGDRVELTFDATAWVVNIDFDALFDAAAQVDADADGSSEVEVEVEVAPNTQAYRAVHHGFVTNARPEVRFE